MFFAQYYLDCLSQASYMIADETTGKAVVVDPRRDVAEYLADADARGFTVVGVINTHFHADFVAGHLEMAARTGAWIGYGRRAETEYPIRPLADGEAVSLGDVTLKIMETPGHTPESISVLVYERADDAVPYGVLTGDALFIGDVGRPDLLASVGVTAEELGAMLHDSVQNKLMALPDEVRVFPAHGAGSACGKNLSTERQSTIGAQRATNYACRPMSRDEFVAIVTAGQSAAPGYFGYDAALNRQDRALFDPAAAPRPLTAEEFTARRAAGAVVVDTRDPQAFAAGHLRGALNIPADGRFAEQAGTVLPADAELLVVADQNREEEIVTRLARIGFDRVGGYLRSPDDALAALAEEVAPASRLTVAQVRAALDGDTPPVVVDVRNCGERAEHGAVDGALHIALGELPRRLDEIPRDRPLVLHCAGGHRSSIAASLLRHHGFTDVSDILGGYAAWAAQAPAPAA
ncbi:MULTISPECIES: rhodanese-like domain-containing protein [Streptomyces]|uniref:Beta-lactamase hydrolase-like protein n=1 Tax=Streptomyces fradiae ATCC 10745 = DSM 40063 TaxID=1319510 RepID=A0A1Y2NXH0_STRFR|nr:MULTISPECIES: rhodanese-like domain-containing protein [Streptomyces]KAF0647930.1 sulfurtransferase [Streptomyces fradiae ATCC 10745 = DSM 40063]OSY52216.1 Beta-lactamase hydrolase-like protein [Streptomyces fradiae ATCC 10745 = DSM 40063]QEV14565.1 MBL fold metallo-hydrolase [Streptomyces fradiae ATCC 10745 = DSM 40063]